MSSEWKEVALTDIYEIRSGLSKPAKDFGSGYPFLAFKDVFYNFFVPDELSQLVQSSEKERQGCSVLRGDVFLTRTSETMHELGMSCVALKDYENATFNGFCKRLRPKPSVDIVPEYVGYYLRSPKFRNEMLAFSTMSTRASLNNEMIGRLKISFPSVTEQKAIAWVLKTLDDKIDINQRMNRTLEEMAQALFKSWFVDFDPVIDNALAAGNPIPESFQKRAEQRKALLAKNQIVEKPNSPVENLADSENIRQLFPDKFILNDEMGWIPEGWEVSTIGKQCDFQNGYAFKSKDLLSQPDNSYHVFKMGNIKRGGGFNSSGTKSYFPKSNNNLSKYLLKKGDVLMAMTDMKSNMVILGHTALMPVSNIFMLNQRVGNIRLKETSYLDYSYLYLYTNYKDVVEELRSRANSGVQVNLSTYEIKNTLLLLPENKVHKIFNLQAVEFFEKTFKCNFEIESLSALRDTLLPKLISGELQIPEAKEQVEAAIK